MKTNTLGHWKKLDEHTSNYSVVHQMAESNPVLPAALRGMSWREVGNNGYPTERGWPAITRSVLLGSKIFVFGLFTEKGRGNFESQAYVFYVDINVREWSGIRLREKNLDLSAAVVVNDQVFCFGTNRARTTEASSEIVVFDAVLLDLGVKTAYDSQQNGYHQVLSGCSANYLESKGQIVVFGGGFRELTNALYVYNLASSSWAFVKAKGSFPAARAHHNSCVQNETIFIYGGVSRQGPYRDLYTLTYVGICLVWSRPDIFGRNALPKMCHTLTSFRGGLILLGGGHYRSSDSKCFTLSLDTWTWNRIATPQGKTFGKLSVAWGDMLVTFGCDSDGFKPFYVLSTAAACAKLIKTTRRLLRQKRLLEKL